LRTPQSQETRDMNIVDLLLFEHDQQEALLGELKEAGGAERAALFQRLARMLAVHEAAEEVVLYPVVRANFGDGHRLARQATRDEDQIKKHVADLQAGEVLLARDLRELEEMVRAHHEMEEREFIAVLPRVQVEAQLGGLASAYQIFEHLAPIRGHRHAPTGPLGNVLLGTPVAIVDRVRSRMGNAVKR
jgi:Hemerythrin HHE cation binding domain